MDLSFAPPTATPGIAFAPQPPTAANWDYERAFARNEGLISREEQQVLRRSRVAIAGMGGVGGVHLITLARLGIGSFSIADPDTFDIVNFNRQYGANTRTVGRSKVEVMAQEALAINPELDLRIIRGPVTPDNVDRFLDGADLLIDGIDFFSIAARRMVFAEARARGRWAVTAGPIGFSTAWLAFDPQGMSFDRYFDMRDEMTPAERLIAFAVGLTPRATQLPYLDLSKVDPESGVGPSASLACQLAAGVASAAALKVLLGRGKLRAAPCYAQFDAFRGILRSGTVWGGNRHPLQRLKRALLRRRVAG